MNEEDSIASKTAAPQERPFTYSLIGPGAIGLNYGAQLVKSGVALHLLARADYHALQARGITYREVDPQTGDVSEVPEIRPRSVVARAEELPPSDCVLTAAKATVNEALVETLGQAVRSNETIILTLQNGMGNAEFFARHFPENPILVGICFVCANRTAPGVVENYHPGRVQLGSYGNRWPAIARKVVADFSGAGIRTDFSEDLNASIWRKLCWNIPFNGLSIAAGGLTTDRILADPALTHRARALMEEVRAAASRDGREISEKFIQSQFDLTAKMGAYRPSSLIDYQEGRPVEVEAIWGEPLRRGQALGLQMPELAKLYSQIRSLVK